MVPLLLRADQTGLKIGLHGGYGLDGEVVHQDLEDRRGHKGWEARAKPDVLDAKMQQRQEDTDRLLLVPGQHQGQRQGLHGGSRPLCALERCQNPVLEG